MVDNRLSNIDVCIKMAKDIALRSPCINRRRFGSIIVKNDAVISMGYNGTARGALNCGIDVQCLQILKDVEHCKDYSSCAAIHSEQNGIINAARNGISVLGSTLFLGEANGKGDRPCFQCRRFMINAGIKDCYYEDRDGSIKHENVADWVDMENKWIKAEYEKWKPKNVGQG
jgi:dCMP deaminase